MCSQIQGSSLSRKLLCQAGSKNEETSDLLESAISEKMSEKNKASTPKHLILAVAIFLCKINWLVCSRLSLQSKTKNHTHGLKNKRKKSRQKIIVINSPCNKI